MFRTPPLSEGTKGQVARARAAFDGVLSREQLAELRAP